MSANPTTISPSSAPQIKPNQTYIVGKIELIDQFTSQAGQARLNNHRVVLPAVDEYSAPFVVTVQSVRKLGQVGEELRQLCYVAGYRDSWTKQKGEDAGEVVQTTRMFLKAVE